MVFVSSLQSRRARSPVDWSKPHPDGLARAWHWVRWGDWVRQGGTVGAAAPRSIWGWASAAAATAAPGRAGPVWLALAERRSAERAELVARLRECASAEPGESAVGQVRRASFMLGAALLDGDDAAVAGAFDAMRPASRQWLSPLPLAVAEARASAGYEQAQSWPLRDRPGLVLWLLPRLPESARGPAAQELLDGLVTMGDALASHAVALEGLVPYLDRMSIERLMQARGEVDPLHTPGLLLRLAELGRPEPALRVVNATEPPRARLKQARLLARLFARLPVRLEGEAALADRLLALAPHMPELWAPALPHVSDTRLEELETGALEAGATRACLLLSSLPASRVASFAEAWRAHAGKERASRHALVAAATRSALLSEQVAAALLLEMLEALSEVRRRDLLDAVDGADLRGVLPLIEVLAGHEALVPLAEGVHLALEET